LSLLVACPVISPEECSMYAQKDSILLFWGRVLYIQLY